MNVSVRSLSLFLAILAGLASVSTTRAQTTVSTDPVGYIQETLTPSPDGVNRVFSPVSFPLHQAPVFVGLVASTSSNTITLSGSIPSGLTASPYMVHVESSSNAIATGQTFLITAAGTNFVTVPSPAFSVQSILGTNDQVAIRGAETLGSIFGSGTSSVMLKQGANAGNSDILYIWGGNAWTEYYFNSIHACWVQSGDPAFTNQNNFVIYPDEGVFVSRSSTNSLPVTYASSMGSVPSNAQTISLNAPGFTFVSNPLPTSLTLSTFGFTNSPSWLKGASAGNSDVVYIWAGNSWTEYYFNSVHSYWVQSGDPQFTNENSFPISSGTAVLVSRNAADSPAVTPVNAYIPVPLNYTP